MRIALVTASQAVARTGQRLLSPGRLRNLIVASIMLLVIGIAAFALSRVLADTSWAEIRAAIDRIGSGRLLASLGFTVASYVVLTGYDVAALRIINRHVAYPRTALASFTSYIFSHNFGFTPLTAGTARVRVYRIAGLTIFEVAQVMLIAGISLWLGILLLFAIGLIVQPGAFIEELLYITPPLQMAAGIVGLVGMLAYVGCLHWRAGRPINLFGWTLPVPGVRMALVQFGLGVLDLTIATTALFVLLPDATVAHFPLVLFAYLAGLVSGLITHAPGGVGVFEVVMLLALPEFDRAALFGALLVFRAVYFLLPLAVGLLLFAWHEVIHWRLPNGQPVPAISREP
jgi:uncharacterized membrane protein YbhN (UPF0104 family)